MHHFKAMMKEANHLKKIKKLKVKTEEMSDLEGYYQVRSMVPEFEYISYNDIGRFIKA